MSANLFAHASHHIRWLDKFPTNIVPEAKLLAAAVLVHNSIKLSDNVTDRDKHLLFQCWRGTLQQREIMIAETLPTTFMCIASNTCTVVMHHPYLIQRAHTPAENLTSHPDATVGNINEEAIACIKDLHLNDLLACDFSAQHLHD